MRNRLIYIKTIIIFFVLLATNTYAVPNLISYQGVLNDSGGSPMSTTVNMTFRIYDVDTGGTALWNETQSVLVSNGLFNVKLGSVQQLTSNVFNIDNLFLAIQVGSDAEMTPRQRITSAAFALKTTSSIDSSPIGTITAWSRNTISINNTVDCSPGYILIDNNSDFFVSSIKPGMRINLIQKSDNMQQFTNAITGNDFILIDEILLSNSTSDGNLVSKVMYDVGIVNNLGYSRIKFFYTDGSTAFSNTYIDGHYISWATANNPNENKLVWKVETWGFAYSSSNTIIFQHIDVYLSEDAIIKSVDSANQLTLENDLFKANGSFTYTIFSAPYLSNNWVECNGQTIIDPDSYYHNQTLPDLNGGSPFIETSIPVVWIMKIK